MPLRACGKFECMFREVVREILEPRGNVRATYVIFEARPIALDAIHRLAILVYPLAFGMVE